MSIQPKNPLHGITLQTIIETLQTEYGWEELGCRIKINCFTENQSVKSSLTFLRKTPWAREKVEKLYLMHRAKQERALHRTQKSL
jgi:uncharacterized protein (DUF2132 family)